MWIFYIYLNDNNYSMSNTFIKSHWRQNQNGVVTKPCCADKPDVTQIFIGQVNYIFLLRVRLVKCILFAFEYKLLKNAIFPFE